MQAMTGSLSAHLASHFDHAINVETLSCNRTTDVLQAHSLRNWAGGIVRQYSRLGMASPFSSSGIIGLDSLGFQAKMKGQLCKVWDGLHVSPRKEGRKCTHPWQPTRLNGWNRVCLSSARHVKASNDVPADHGLVSGPHKPSHDT